MKFLSILQERGLSYAINGVSFSPPKNMDHHMQFMELLFLLQKKLSIIRNFRNFYPFSKNLDYHMQILEFLSLLHKCGLSYASLKNSFLSPKTWTYICNLWNFFLFSKAWTIICHFWNFNPFSTNVDYHKQVTKTSFPSQKTWTIICNL